MLKEAPRRDVARLSELLDLSEPMWPDVVPASERAANAGALIEG